MSKQSPAPVTGPSRFRAEPVNEPRSVVRALIAGLTLLVIIVGVPTALLHFTGAPPLPGHWSLDALTGELSLTALLGVLIWVIWAAWLQFTVCAIVELVSAARGSGMPAHLPLSGGMQTVVRVLVSSLLIFGAATPASAATFHGGPVVPGANGPAASAQADPSIGDNTQSADFPSSYVPGAPPGGAVDGAQQTGVRYMLGDQELDPQLGAELVGQRVYIVRPPDGLYHDNLWDIAERSLGDGRAYQQIYDLNAGRVQPDGRSLELARLIQPNWLLIMPESAQGVDRVVAVPVPERQAPAVPSAPQEQGHGGADAVGRSSALGDLRPTQLPAVGGLLAASITGALILRRRRGLFGAPGDGAGERERLLRISADPERTARLDAALRSLPEKGQALSIYAAIVDDSSISVYLAWPSLEAPEPWTCSEDGMIWSLSAQAAANGLPTHPGAPRYPGLVTLGRNDDGADVLIDLASADSDVVVTGDPRMAEEIITALALEVGLNPWSGRAGLTGIGLPRQLGAILGPRLTVLDSPAMLPTAPAPDVLEGRSLTDSPEIVFVSGHDVPVVAGRGLSMVRTGSAERARWQIIVDDSGTAQVAPLGIRVTASRATELDLTALAELFATDRQQPTSDDGRPPIPDPPAPPLSSGAFHAAPVRISLLGSVMVEAPGPVERSRLDLLTEAAACVALHPQGIRPATLGGLLWPAGVTGDVVASTIERLRAWLGADAQGIPHLREDEEGRLLLGPGAVTDWDVLRSLLAQSRTAPEHAERDLLIEALRMVRGPIAQGAPQGRYAWLARARTERDAGVLIVDAALRAAALLRGPDPDGAAGAIRVGLQVLDLDQSLWRERLRLTSRHGRPALAQDVLALLDLAGVDDLHRIDPLTAALVEDLAPGLSVMRIPA